MTPLYLSILARQTRAIEAQTLALQDLAHAVKVAFNLPLTSPPSDRQPYKASLRDLASVSPDDAQSLSDARSDFAKQANVVPDSEAFYKSVKDYEEAVVQQFGEEARQDLPWNRIRTADTQPPTQSRRT